MVRTMVLVGGAQHGELARLEAVEERPRTERRWRAMEGATDGSAGTCMASQKARVAIGDDGGGRCSRMGGGCTEETVALASTARVARTDGGALQRSGGEEVDARGRDGVARDRVGR